MQMLKLEVSDDPDVPPEDLALMEENSSRLEVPTGDALYCENAPTRLSSLSMKKRILPLQQEPCKILCRETEHSMENHHVLHDMVT